MHFDDGCDLMLFLLVFWRYALLYCVNDHICGTCLPDRAEGSVSGHMQVSPAQPALSLKQISAMRRSVNNYLASVSGLMAYKGNAADYSHVQHTDVCIGMCEDLCASMWMDMATMNRFACLARAMA